MQVARLKKRHDTNPHLISVLRRALKKQRTEKFRGGRGADCKGEVE